MKLKFNKNLFQAEKNFFGFMRLKKNPCVVNFNFAFF